MRRKLIEWTVASALAALLAMLAISQLFLFLSVFSNTFMVLLG